MFSRYKLLFRKFAHDMACIRRLTISTPQPKCEQVLSVCCSALRTRYKPTFNDTSVPHSGELSDIDESGGSFQIAFPFDCSRAIVYDICFSSEYIMLVHHSYWTYLIQVYDRWTLQLVNAIHIRNDSYYPNICFVDNSVFIHYRLHTKGSSTVVWNQAAGKVHTLLSNCQRLVYTFCVSKLILLLREDGNRWVASVYKCNDDTCEAPELIVNDEPLPILFLKNKPRPKVILSDNRQLYFGILGNHVTGKGTMNYVCQLRSKQDFSLLRTIVIENKLECPLHHSFFLLSDCFLLANSVGQSLDVLSLVDGVIMERVYTFKMSNEMSKTLNYARDIYVVGDFLVLQDASPSTITGAAYSAAIWRLPSNFIETCFRHLKEGTVGITFECDYLVGKHRDTQLDVFDRLYINVDQNRVTKIHINDLNPNVMNLMMLNNTILEENDSE